MITFHVSDVVYLHYLSVLNISSYYHLVSLFYLFILVNTVKRGV